MGLNRREAIKKAAYVMGGALTAPTIAGIMKGCAPTMEPNWKPDYFSKEQAVTIMELSECILPATDTLGAKDLGVPRYIEEMVAVIYNRKNRESFMSGLQVFNKKVDDLFGKRFEELTDEQKNQVVHEENEKLRTASERGWFYTMKELTITGFFTSEYGATKILQWQLVPVQWNGCIPVKEAGNGTRYFA